MRILFTLTHYVTSQNLYLSDVHKMSYKCYSL